MYRRYIFIAICLLVFIGGLFPDKNPAIKLTGSYLAKISASFLFALTISILIYLFESVLQGIKKKFKGDSFRSKHSNSFNAEKIIFYVGMIFTLFGISNSIGNLLNYHMMAGPSLVALGFGSGFLFSRILWWIAVDRHRGYKIIP